MLNFFWLLNDHRDGNLGSWWAVQEIQIVLAKAKTTILLENL